MTLQETSSELISQQSTFDETGLTLSQRGLYIARAVLPGQIDDAMDAVRRLRQFRDRDEYHVKLLDRGDVKAQRAIGNILVTSTKEKLEQVIPAYQESLTATVVGAGLIPRRDDQGSIVIIDFDADTQEAILDDRDDIIDLLEGFAPEGYYDWKEFARPGMPVGFLWEHNTAQERRLTLEALENNLPDEIIFNFASHDL